jgi:hypothetical protein
VQHHGALDQVAELADVAGEGIGEQLGFVLGRELGYTPVESLRNRPSEMSAVRERLVAAITRAR